MPDGENYIDREASNSVEDTRPKPYTLIGLKRVKHFEAIPGAAKLPKIRNKKARKQEISTKKHVKEQPSTSSSDGGEKKIVQSQGSQKDIKKFKKPQLQGTKKKKDSRSTLLQLEELKKVSISIFQ